MAPDAYKKIKDVAHIFNIAQMEVLSPTIFGLGKELSVLSIALRAIGDNPKIYDELMHTWGITSIIEHADVIMREIAADEAFTRLMHDRICTVTHSVNAFLPESKGRLASNFIAHILRIAPELSKLKDTLYPAQETTEEEPLLGSLQVEPERERFKETLHHLSVLKNKLQNATSS
jgi:hypothetical protein